MIDFKKEERRLISMYRAFEELNYNEGQDEILSFLRRVQNHSLYIAFCGHYSSGKSTLINHLFKERFLPTSPIPTSGNVVQVSSGLNNMVVHRKDGKIEKYEEKINDKNFQLLCKDGNSIFKIELYSQNPLLKKGITLIDTPGIDSTDECHLLATESIIPIADVVFYILDYHFVNAEINIDFIMNLKARHKKIILVINQIDKHRNEELSYEAYKNKIINFWSENGIRKSDIFFTSLKDFDLEENEWDKIEIKLN